MRQEKYELFVCECSSMEHQIVFSRFDDQDDHLLYATIHLTPIRSIWKRIWYAIKYIFGYRCKYGQFEEFMFRREDADKLQGLVNYLKNGSL